MNSEMIRFEGIKFYSEEQKEMVQKILGAVESVCKRSVEYFIPESQISFDEITASNLLLYIFVDQKDFLPLCEETDQYICKFVMPNVLPRDNDQRERGRYL